MNRKSPLVNLAKTKAEYHLLLTLCSTGISSNDNGFQSLAEKTLEEYRSLPND